MADALDAACKKVDDLIMGDDASKLRVDPDDPWAEIWDPPRHVYKERCAKTGYLMTKPFERHNPMPCLLYTSPSPRDATLSRMPSSA